MLADDTDQSEQVVLGALRADVGCEVGKYHLIAEIARGGMGVVYLAILRGIVGFRKLVVLKELRKERLDSEAFVNMFIGEARLTARLNHPNIVQTIEVGADGGRLFIAMEYLDGQPLQQLVRRSRQCGSPLPLPVHLGILIEVLTALEYAHDLTDFDGTPLGIVHRDVSPPNVFVTYEGQIKLVDFGISTSSVEVADQREGLVAGKMRYMAPEQAAGVRADRRADLFAVGVMLWEASVGRRPWAGQADAAVLERLASGAVPCVHDVSPEIDPDLAAIVDRAMKVVPEARYATAHEMREDLERYIRKHHVALPTARSLGALVSQLFAEDREWRRGLIDAQLTAMTRDDPVDGSPIAASDGEMPVHVLGARPPPSRYAATLSLRPPPDAIPGSSATPSVSPPVPSVAGRSSSAFAVAMTVVIGAMLVLAGMVGHRLRAGDIGGGKVAAAAKAPVVVAAAPAAAPTMLHIVVTASPVSALLYLDDVAVPNPYIADRVRDATAHRLRVEALGYEPKTRTFTLAQDIDVQIDLARQPAALAPNAKVEPPAPPPECQPPYVLDSVTGKKHWRLECL